MKILIFNILILFLLLNFSFSQKNVELDNILKPDSIYVEKEFLYVTEGALINVYSVKDFKFIRKFGKLGEGPEEFKITSYGGSGLFLDILADKILVSSVGKLSIFDLKGKFIKEMKAPYSFFGNLYMGLKNGYVGIGSNVTGQNNFISLDLYSSEMKKIKEVRRWESPYNPGKGTKVFEDSAIFNVIDEDRIIAASGNTFTLDIFDSTGKKINAITQKYQRLKVSESVKKEVIKFFKTSPSTKNVYQFIKPIKFPEYLPAIRSVQVKNGKIYIVTFKTEKKKTELYIYNKNGKLLSQTSIPIKLMSPLIFYPSDIWDGKLYQLIEDEETEVWKLHISDIE